MLAGAAGYIGLHSDYSWYRVGIIRIGCLVYWSSPVPRCILILLYGRAARLLSGSIRRGWRTALTELQHQANTFPGEAALQTVGRQLDRLHWVTRVSWQFPRPEECGYCTVMNGNNDRLPHRAPPGRTAQVICPQFTVLSGSMEMEIGRKFIFPTLSRNLHTGQTVWEGGSFTQQFWCCEEVPAAQKCEV